MRRRQLNFRSMALKYGAVCLAVGVGFVPGPAHWHSTVNGEIYGLPCLDLVPNCGRIAVRQDSTDLVYGAGLQFKLGSAALRVEYERIEAHPEYPYMSQVGLTWTF